MFNDEIGFNHLYLFVDTLFIKQTAEIYFHVWIHVPFLSFKEKSLFYI